MTFHDKGVPNQLEVNCDRDGCDSATLVQTRSDVAGVNQLPYVMDQLNSVDWEMKLIQNTWVGEITCSLHTQKVVELAYNTDAKSYLELLELAHGFVMLADHVHTSVVSDGKTEDVQFLIGAMVSNGNLIDLIREVLDNSDMLTSPYSGWKGQS